MRFLRWLRQKIGLLSIRCDCPACRVGRGEIEVGGVMLFVSVNGPYLVFRDAGGAHIAPLGSSDVVNLRDALDAVQRLRAEQVLRS